MTIMLDEKVEALEEKTESLESILSRFIISTNTALTRLEHDTNTALTRLEREMREFKNEMSAFKDEMSAFKKDAEADRKQMNKRWGELANKMGTIVEDIVAPNIPRIAKQYFKIESLEFFAIRVNKINTKDKSKRKEFDVIAISDGYFIINETKATPRMEYIKEFIDFLPEIKDYFPEMGNRRLIPIFSSLSIPENMENYLTNNRVYAMAMTDDTMDLLNFDKIE